jgi:APA family basic amino acid/polyamine antiporter
MLGVVDDFTQSWLHDPMRYLVALSACAILAAACSAAMLGVSRLGYSLAINRQLPSRVGYLHPEWATPVVIIGIGAVGAVLLLLTADLEFLLGISAFGATLAFTLVCLSVCVLRYREPDRDRPFRMPLNVRVGSADLPIPAALGTLLSGAAFISVLAFHGGARWMGLGWMAFGVLVYVYYRVSEDKPLLKRISVPETVLTRKRAEAEYGSILVPISGMTLDDDIVQTAGRLAAEENDDVGEGGAVIEALWVFEVPMALPLDTPVPDAELKRARKALARAKAVGEEYEGVEVATAVVRARRTGEAIVREAKRRGVEAIVLAAEEPTRLRGGVLYGGKQGLRDTFVGETTRYVVNKAQCRVLLTAPPGDGQDPTRVADEAVEVPGGHLPVPSG